MAKSRLLGTGCLIMAEKAIVLVSGGLDSATVLALCRSDGFECHMLSFDYGQRHRLELKAASKLARALGVQNHIVLKIDLRQFGGSSLTSDAAVPKLRSIEEIGTGIPVTYVPARNT